MAKIEIKVDVIDDELCRDCKKFRLTEDLKKRKDAYGFEYEERILKCAHKELCEHLIEFISVEKFLHVD